jgi:hypothetical protein
MVSVDFKRLAAAAVDAAFTEDGPATPPQRETPKHSSHIKGIGGLAAGAALVAAARIAAKKAPTLPVVALKHKLPDLSELSDRARDWLEDWLEEGDYKRESGADEEELEEPGDEEEAADDFEEPTAESDADFDDEPIDEGDQDDFDDEPTAESEEPEEDEEDLDDEPIDEGDEADEEDLDDEPTAEADLDDEAEDDVDDEDFDEDEDEDQEDDEADDDLEGVAAIDPVTRPPKPPRRARSGSKKAKAKAG